ncbi:MAG: chain length determinant protein EpsF [Pseudomonadota bacterium]|nr:chain length determinant protein EpsF [Pseudomonadota bacterium]
MGLAQMLRVLRGRAVLFTAIVLAVLTAVAVISLLSPKKYVAELALVVDLQGTDPMKQTALAPMLVPAHLATQTEIIRSRNVALKVIEKMGLATNPAIVAAFRESGAETDLTSWLVDALLRNVDAKTARSSNIIRISYGSPDPVRSAEMANAFAEAYIQTSLELRVDPARRQVTWYEEQVSQLRDQLVASQSRLSKYQSDHGVLGVDAARMDVENARLQEISNQLVSVQAQMFDANSRSQQITSSEQLDSLPDLMKNPTIQSLKAELARAESKLAEVSERYGVNHPQYIASNAEVTSLKSKLNVEIGVTRGSLVQSAAIARRQVGDVQKALEEQKDRIIALKRQQDELSVLSRDVESARTAYDAALQQANQTKLESRVDRTNVAILNQATPPLLPDSPKVLLNLVVGLFAGIALAIGLILTLEVCNRRLRSVEDLADFTDLPVLAELPPLPAAALRHRRREVQRALKLQPNVAPAN